LSRHCFELPAMIAELMAPMETPRHPIGLDVSLTQGLKHPRLIGTQRASALQNEGDAITPFRLPTAHRPLVGKVCGRNVHGALPLKLAP
jgi:hypothetical protein